MDQTVFEFLFYMAAKTDSIVFGDNQYNLGFSDLYVHDFIGDDGLLCKASSDKLGACIINSWRSYIIDIETCIQFHKIIYLYIAFVILGKKLIIQVKSRFQEEEKRIV